MKNNRFNLWKCSPGATFFAALLAILFLGTGCSDFDPLDSYSRIPPDRSQNDDEEGGGLFESGYGTESEPYVIVNAEQLQRMANALVSDKFVYFQLGADIDMSGIENWTPLNSIDPYNKFISFDGNNHVIKNFSCSGKSYSSFFGVLNGECKNVGFVNANVSGTNATGIIGGYIGDGNADERHVGYVENCYVTGTVTSTNDATAGLFGKVGAEKNGVKNVVVNCYSTADVMAQSGDAGGLIGVGPIEITNSYCTGSVSSATGAVGGIVGSLNNKGVVTNCIGWNKEFMGSKNIAGVIGWSNGDATWEVADCYTWEGIKGFTGQTNAWPSPSQMYNGTVKSNAELQEIARAWGGSWSATTNKGYPVLEWQVARGDYAELAGHSEMTEPEGPGDPTELPEGEGTEAAPYLLATANHLVQMKSLVKGGETVYFKLTADIDMSEVADWEPLNYADPYDKAVDFNGNGHTISGFTCSFMTYPSFFGVLNGKVYDVAFEDANVKAVIGSHAGVIGGYIGTGGISATLERVAVQGRVEGTGGGAVGGIGGIAKGTITIVDCYADVDVISTATGIINLGIGGLIGDVYSNTRIEDCYATGTVDGATSANDGLNAGGLCGRLVDASPETVILRNCIAWNESVDGRAASGRIWGRDWDALELDNCYAKADMEVLQDNAPRVSKYAQAEDGLDCDDICATAQSLGWSSEVWDLGGGLPTLKSLK